MPIDKRFNRSAYDRYQQLKAKLLSLGYRCLQRGQTFKSSDLVADGT